MIIKENISLKPFNTFGIDAKAKHFAVISELQDLYELYEKGFLNDRFLLLGGGSNILFTGDYEGIVILNSLGGIEVNEAAENEVIVKAGAGVEWNELVWYCIDREYGGIENLSLIPGSLGAAPIQNIGAYGVELKDCFVSLEAFDIQTGEIKEFNRQECRFGYRDSIFKHTLKGKVVILSVSLKLQKDKPPDTTYGAIREQLKLMRIKDPPDIRSVGLAVTAIRRAKLPDPEVTGNAGSFFKNPVITYSEFVKIKHKFPDIPHYISGHGRVKVPAAWMIEQCGWKGKRLGYAGVHAKQALVLVNHGKASGNDILALATAIRCSVSARFAVDLEMEVNVV
ncbi:MAG: UDP-N-acetylmuramate dehydrogenase [Bacteroidales bacterium]|nr:UDP-N-acetylmuramate dehydrogenase [Bacteroidales bacterium]